MLLGVRVGFVTMYSMISTIDSRISVRVGFVTMYSMISTIDSRISYVSCGLNLGCSKGQEHYESKR
ncbi:hypothetical protein AT1G61565 [Arabidopsis thaliana]|uniref:Uncharacterized protein n=1 Tax=Arabidopsis thaliana TaxID=3702 RepID=A0A1P8AUK0_ARATH|nr:uncharacterized protein AT1G61565 [Arabidopsis thaliana]ANM60315.1 hypothetical protein AT1G61565 [Arabidopsis thaliana]|eukprot:NP_001322612.1 hypothetical protein AT1G61565 [Arabidopsis thaliana]